MKNNFEEQLIKELYFEGMLDFEKEEFTKILSKIKNVSEVKRSEAFKGSFLNKLTNKDKKMIFFTTPKIYIPALVLILLLFVLITEVVNAQRSLPGQPLYPIKLLSEKFIKKVNPSFKNEILKRRSEEIKNLTGGKKNSDLIKKTLDDYKKELESKENINSLMIKESKRNLEEARGKTEDKDKEEIENLIKKTEDKIIEIHRDEQKEEDKEIKIEEVKSAQTSQEEEKKREDHKREKDKSSEEDRD